MQEITQKHIPKHDITYLNNLSNMIKKIDWNMKTVIPDRTNTGRYSFFGSIDYYHMDQGFPLLTTKKMFWKNVIHELIWFLRGETNIQYLKDNNVKIWDSWADSNGDLGPVYGSQWRNHNGIDQIADLVYGLKNKPYSRRHIVSAWNPAEVNEMALPPCHTLFQCHVEPVINHNPLLHLQLYQRSADYMIGVPYNIASYSLLLHIIATYCGYQVGTFIHTIGDCHLYTNHLDGARNHVNRLCENIDLPIPRLKVATNIQSYNDLSEVTSKDIELINYDCLEHIKLPVAV